MSCGGQLRTIKCFILPKQTMKQFIDLGRMEGLIGVGGESDPRTWNWMQVTASACSDCDTTSIRIHYISIMLNYKNAIYDYCAMDVRVFMLH